MLLIIQWEMITINILELEIKSRLKYQIMFFACALLHTIFFLIFSIMEIYMLMTFNIISVSFYIVGAYACGTDNFEKNAFKWSIAVYSEINLHAIACTIHLGYETYFFLYTMLGLSISAYMLFFCCDRKIFFKMMMVNLIILLAALAGCQLYLAMRPPTYTYFFNKSLSDKATSYIRLMNITFSTLAIFIFSVMFVIEINLLIRKLNAAYDKLSYTAMHDSLTGLYNRHSLRDFFESLSESTNDYCIALGDIDNFKRVNDTYGHDCGDRVLVTVSDIIKDSMEEQDIACRWGGEEILIIMRGGRDVCLKRMKGIRERINASVVEAGSRTISVTMTFGFADCHEMVDKENKIDAMVILVDGRLYVGKKSGKNVIIDTGCNEDKNDVDMYNI